MTLIDEFKVSMVPFIEFKVENQDAKEVNDFTTGSQKKNKKWS